MIHAECERLLTPIVEDLGCQLWACEMIAQGKYSLLRVYIDKPEGITLDDCERVSCEVSVFLDMHSPVTGQYTLEVSSPGINRPLFKEEHFQRYIGSEIQLQLRHPIERRRKFNGELIEVRDDGMIVIQEKNEAKIIPMIDIVKANLM